MLPFPTAARMECFADGGRPRTGNMAVLVKWPRTHMSWGACLYEDKTCGYGYI